jgi:hypothetical protein
MLKTYNPFANRLAWETRDCKICYGLLKDPSLHELKGIRTFVFPSTCKIAIYASAFGSSLKYA